MRSRSAHLLGRSSSPTWVARSLPGDSSSLFRSLFRRHCSLPRRGVIHIAPCRAVTDPQTRRNDGHGWLELTKSARCDRFIALVGSLPTVSFRISSGRELFFGRPTSTMGSRRRAAAIRRILNCVSLLSNAECVPKCSDRVFEDATFISHNVFSSFSHLLTSVM